MHNTDMSVRKQLVIAIRAVLYLDDIADIDIIAMVRSCRLLGRHCLFRAQATTTVHDAVHTSAFEFRLAQRAIVGPVHAYTQVEPLNQLLGSAVDQKLQDAPVNI